MYYIHYKDRDMIYKFKGTAVNTETGEKLMIYKSMYDKNARELWARPYDMFFEEVTSYGKKVPRFSPVTGLKAVLFSIMFFFK